MNLEDTQAEYDDRGIAIDEVGISGLSYPVTVFDTTSGKQETVAKVTICAELSAERKGSHLSRFIEVFDDHASDVTPESLVTILRTVQERLLTTKARIQLTFPYFLRRYAPITGRSALMDYSCGISVSVDGDATEYSLVVRVPVTSVCPCSKAISDYGAHNQRGYVTVNATPVVDVLGEMAPVWFEDLIAIAESASSSPVYPLLKRADERYVTMLGYDQPVFVEDIVRSVTQQLHVDSRIDSFSIDAVNDESIHNHGAFARITCRSNLGG